MSAINFLLLRTNLQSIFGVENAAIFGVRFADTPIARVRHCAFPKFAFWRDASVLWSCAACKIAKIYVWDPIFRVCAVEFQFVGMGAAFLGARKSMKTWWFNRVTFSKGFLEKKTVFLRFLIRFWQNFATNRCFQRRKRFACISSLEPLKRARIELFDGPKLAINCADCVE